MFNGIRISIRRLAGGAAKPHWGEPPKHRWQPFLLDRTHYGEHPTYNGFVLLLRYLRPRIEKVLSSTFSTLSSLSLSLYNPVKRLVLKHNPDIRYDLGNMLMLGTADDLNEQGFWNSMSEDKKEREKYFEKEQDRLNKLWERALEKATVSESFEDLCSFVVPKSYEVPTGVVPPILYFNFYFNIGLGRFNMIQYGKDNEDSHTFDTPSHEQPLRSLALNFTYNNLSGDWGDYINRQDNKGPLMRPSRQMFTDIFIPGTK
ncbi:uncharacterized protein TA18110 [Theileria annulata]|uniref:Uncharacterized protein n=1 Tax=Theileria annulata TaxID=5874 RepID=Q4UB29_THEAN|nr:uncharacterized protein TA18110 [Theileria annulata]CAI75972.1 hypothetical protein, conserved [Theileria annulata]|eukprot:XP_955448.1 hypothetical protein, conserved [Theileria annulata]